MHSKEILFSHYSDTQLQHKKQAFKFFRLASAEGIATLQSLCPEVGCPYPDELCSTTCGVALVVLWMGLHQEKFPLLATSLQAAAGVVGRQKWALILPSSARVSLVTYTAVIAVRYPELDNVQNDLVCFGNYLLGEQATSGGFLPIFWDAPSAYMHAATDIGSAVDWLQRQVTLSSDENGCLAVLHNFFSLLPHCSRQLRSIYC